jgi:hypothetical protein
MHYGVLADFLVLDPDGFDLLPASDQMPPMANSRTDWLPTTSLSSK